MTRQDVLPGTRVTAVVWGKPKVGTVLRRTSVAWVRWDGADRETWMHFDSLHPERTVTP